MTRAETVVADFERDVGRALSAEERAWLEEQAPYARARFIDALAAFGNALTAALGTVRLTAWISRHASRS